jgi:hypothetical protein
MKKLPNALLLIILFTHATPLYTAFSQDGNRPPPVIPTDAQAEYSLGLHKVLFMSGYTNDALVRHGFLEAKIAFLQKPFSPDALARKVREILNTQVMAQ